MSKQEQSRAEPSRSHSQRGWNGKNGAWGALRLRVFAIIMALVLCFGWPNETAAYAVLAHEAIIDSAWDTNIRPLLLKRCPDATAEELKEAHG